MTTQQLNNVKRWRSQGYTLAQVAKQIGCRRSDIQRALTGGERRPNSHRKSDRAVLVERMLAERPPDRSEAEHLRILAANFPECMT